MMLGELTFNSMKDGKSYILHVNGGKLTIRLADSKPYEAKPIEDHHRTTILQTLYELAEDLSEV